MATKITTREEAIKRIMCEVFGFTDRPDYTMPYSVNEAFHLLFPSEEERNEIYRRYAEWDELDNQARMWSER